jgi:hypothetical protein
VGDIITKDLSKNNLSALPLRFAAHNHRYLRIIWRSTGKLEKGAESGQIQLPSPRTAT